MYLSWSVHAQYTEGSHLYHLHLDTRNEKYFAVQKSFAFKCNVSLIWPFGMLMQTSCLISTKHTSGYTAQSKFESRQTIPLSFLCVTFSGFWVSWCINKEIGFLLVWKITCQRFDWMLETFGLITTGWRLEHSVETSASYFPNSSWQQVTFSLYFCVW